MHSQKKIELIAEVDYYINEDGNMVFTKEYHLKRGFCCKCGCQHCPYNHNKTKEEN